MTWTYSGNPQDSPKDTVRFLCGDTDESFAYVSDEEIAYLLGPDDSVDVRGVALKACSQILKKLALEADYTIGPESVKASQRYKAFKELYDQLKSENTCIWAAPSWDDPALHGRGRIFDIGIHDYRGVRYGSTDQT
ncbi:hypothetical protein D3C76_169810 [compost metagenome]